MEMRGCPGMTGSVVRDVTWILGSRDFITSPAGDADNNTVLEGSLFETALPVVTALPRSLADEVCERNSGKLAVNVLPLPLPSIARFDATD